MEGLKGPVQQMCFDFLFTRRVELQLFAALRYISADRRTKNDRFLNYRHSLPFNIFK